MTEANITWITDQVATGGDLSFNPDKAAAQFNELLAMDIDLVIDCRLEADDQELWDAIHDVDYLHLPVDDVYGSHLPKEHFDAAVEAARPVLKRGGRVFVHCHMGVNRGPSTAFAVLLDQGMPAARAFDLIREKRPVAAIYYANDALKAHLRRRGIGYGTEAASRRIRAFNDHLNKVFGQKERREVNHIIRQNHQQDAIDLGWRVG